MTHSTMVDRNSLIKLLNDDEIAKVSTAEAASGLAAGDEYIDLTKVELGVQKAGASSKPVMGHVIPRNAVQDGTWTKIVSHLHG